MLGSNFSTQLIGRRIDSISVRELKQKQEREAKQAEYLNQAASEVAQGASAAQAPAADPNAPQQLVQDANVAVPGQEDDRNALLNPVNDPQPMDPYNQNAIADPNQPPPGPVGNQGVNEIRLDP